MELVRLEQRQLLEMPRLLVIDLELTCGPGVTHDLQDIIEVGFCVLERGAPTQESAAQSVYIRPERSTINRFCEKLTGITWERVSNQPNFARTAPRLKDLVADIRADAWVSWGQDQTLLHRQSLAAGVANPFEGLEHVDIKRLLTPLIYQLTGGVKPKGAGGGVGLETAMKQLGIQFEGSAHSGAVDAQNTARLVQEVRRLAEPHMKAAAARTLHEPIGHVHTRRMRP